MITTEGLEFKFVISGKCQYQFNHELIELSAGDAVFFDASTPHLPINPFTKAAIMLVIYFATGGRNSLKSTDVVFC